MKKIVEVDMKDVYSSCFMDFNTCQSILLLGIITIEDDLYITNVIMNHNNNVIYQHLGNYFYDIDCLSYYHDDFKNKTKEEVFDYFSDTMSKMPYNIFLESDYWKYIVNIKKESTGNKCQICNSTKYLQTHHNNYKNRGYEYKNLNDLVILCNKCHSTYHKKGVK
jgi:hypothetical protein